ncbi:hypothetical protein VCRA2116O29_560002 [Vibrio crassostreae]|nr:hypothetical protein VCRA2116O29_560002 [Vibrio crassostreae]CAK2520806.1 hypothetical protein VCRA2119O48_590027 [Vibrio crassostreae]CAK3859038.1 hypothetical protein VCRA2123O74_530002 [Vibrio crassostreae]CAK4006182.1 hypothetical protein VCRA212O16_660002 [Vibrio crassostreae]
MIFILSKPINFAIHSKKILRKTNINHDKLKSKYKILIFLKYNQRKKLGNYNSEHLFFGKI